MLTLTDPLDATISISAEEQRSGTLSPQNVQLGALLLHARGYVVLRGAIPETLVSELQLNFKELYDDSSQRHRAGNRSVQQTGEHGATVFWERESRFRIFPRLTGPFASRYVLRNPFADPILAETLGEDYYCKFLSSDTCVKGAVKQPPHRDIEFYDADNVRGCLVNIPIMHCGLHNGPMEVWPGGSHLWRSEKFFKFDLRPFDQDGDNPDVEAFARYFPSEMIELHPGEVMIRDPGMWHRGTPNVSDEPRTMLTGGYFRSDYFYAYGDPFFNMDDAAYQELDPSVQKLFAPFFDKTDWRYRKLRRSQVISKLVASPYGGMPLRASKRWSRAAKRRIRDFAKR